MAFCPPRPALRWTALAAVLILSRSALAEVPAGPPRLSPRQEVRQVVGLSEIAITYSRPSLKDREVWGELVPWGEVWRTGANEATQIEITHDAEVEGAKLEAGTYALFTLPGEKGWTVIFNREAEQWGAFRYDVEKDALRLEVEPRKAAHRETFEITFRNVTEGSTEIVLAWGELETPFTIAFDLDAVAFETASRFVADNPVPDRQNWTWANYFYQQGTHTDEALSWASAVREAGGEIYWSHALEARLLARAGRTADAVARAEAALALAADQDEQRGVGPDSKKLDEELAEWKESKVD